MICVDIQSTPKGAGSNIYSTRWGIKPEFTSPVESDLHCMVLAMSHEWANHSCWAASLRPEPLTKKKLIQDSTQ